MTTPTRIPLNDPHGLFQQAVLEVFGTSFLGEGAENVAETVSLHKMSATLQAMQTETDERIFAGLSLLMGRAFFGNWLRHAETSAALREMSFRVLPLKERLHTALQVFAGYVADWTSAACSLETRPDGWLWDSALSPVHEMFWVGALGALTAWVSGDQVYLVQLQPSDHAGRARVWVPGEPLKG